MSIFDPYIDDYDVNDEKRLKNVISKAMIEPAGCGHAHETQQASIIASAVERSEWLKEQIIKAKNDENQRIIELIETHLRDKVSDDNMLLIEDLIDKIKEPERIV